jgi:hypothetical protein
MQPSGEGGWAGTRDWFVPCPLSSRVIATSKGPIAMGPGQARSERAEDCQGPRDLKGWFCRGWFRGEAIRPIVG